MRPPYHPGQPVGRRATPPSNFPAITDQIAAIVARFGLTSRRHVAISKCYFDMGCPRHGVPSTWGALDMGCPRHGGTLMRIWKMMAMAGCAGLAMAATPALAQDAGAITDPEAIAATIQSLDDNDPTDYGIDSYDSWQDNNFGDDFIDFTRTPEQEERRRREREWRRRRLEQLRALGCNVTGGVVGATAGAIVALGTSITGPGAVVAAVGTTIVVTAAAQAICDDLTTNGVGQPPLDADFGE